MIDSSAFFSTLVVSYAYAPTLERRSRNFCIYLCHLFLNRSLILAGKKLPVELLLPELNLLSPLHHLIITRFYSLIFHPTFGLRAHRGRRLLFSYLILRQTMHGWNLHFHTRVYLLLSVYKERDRQDISSQLLFFSSNLSFIDRYPLSCTFEQCSAFKPSHVSTTYLVRLAHWHVRSIHHRLSLSVCP